MPNANVFTLDEINKILEQLNAHPGARLQYIGSRYVPIFGRKGEDSIEWDNSATYEPLTIVLYQGNSYTSRQFVPVGIEITNQEYWAETGNYNAQIEQYRQEVLQIGAEIDSLKERMVVNVKDYGAVGNGVVDDTDAIETAITAGIANSMPVFFPSGTYLVSGISMTGQADTHEEVILMGANDAIIKTSQTSTPAIRIENYNPYIIGLNFEGAGNATDYSDYEQHLHAMAVNVHNAHYKTVVVNCSINGFKSDGINVIGCTNVFIGFNRIENVYGECILASIQGNNGYIVHNYCSSNQLGIDTNMSECVISENYVKDCIVGITVEDMEATHNDTLLCKVINNTITGVSIGVNTSGTAHKTGNDVASHRVYIAGNYIEVARNTQQSGYETGIKARYAYDTVIQDNIIFVTDPSLVSTTITCHGILLSAVQNAIVKGNFIESKRFGISVGVKGDSAYDIATTNNKIVMNHIEADTVGIMANIAGSSNMVSNNVIINCENGIMAEDTTTFDIYPNEFQGLTGYQCITTNLTSLPYKNKIDLSQYAAANVTLNNVNVFIDNGHVHGSLQCKTSAALSGGVFVANLPNYLRPANTAIGLAQIYRDANSYTIQPVYINNDGTMKFVYDIPAPLLGSNIMIDYMVR